MECPDVTTYIHRRVPLRFAGTETSIGLSHALFSSHQVDRGSMLLLKAVSRSVDLDAGTLCTALDLGCGVGTLGLAIAARCPEAHVRMLDRDALAVCVARHNAREAGLRNTDAISALATDRVASGPGLGYGSWDLVLCNLPAKAGLTVRNSIIASAIAHASGQGVVGLVVVKPIAEDTESLLQDKGATFHQTERGADHTAYVFTAVDDGAVADTGAFDAAAGTDRFYLSSDPVAAAPELVPPSAEYFRSRGVSTTVAGRRVQLDVVHGLPEFDEPSHDTVLLARLALEELSPHQSENRSHGGNGSDVGSQDESGPPAGDAVPSEEDVSTEYARSDVRTLICLDPGQGHLPVRLARAAHPGSRSKQASGGRTETGAGEKRAREMGARHRVARTRLVLASRDVLSLRIARHNVRAQFSQAFGQDRRSQSNGPAGADNRPASAGPSSDPDLVSSVIVNWSDVPVPAGATVMLPVRPAPQTPWLQDISLLWDRVCESGGTLIVAGRGNEIGRIESRLTGHSGKRRKRYRGFRAVLFQSAPPDAM